MKKLAGLLMAMLLLLSQVSTAFAEDTLKQQIAALPSVEEFKAMTPEEQMDVYNRTQYAYAAYMDLPTAEEKAAIEGAEEKFDALFSHFNTMIMPLEEQAVSGKTGHNQFAWVVLLAMAALLALPLLRKKRS